jgi:pyridoxal 5'-phosphate synthase pdxS subunit
MTGTNGNGNGAPRVGTDRVKQGLAQMLKGGVIVSITSVHYTIHPV